MSARLQTLWDDLAQNLNTARSRTETVGPSGTATGVPDRPAGTDRDILAAANPDHLAAPVSAENAAPQAQDDLVQTTEDANIDIDVLANDFDPDNDDLVITGLDLSGTSLPSPAFQLIDADGNITYSGDGVQIRLAHTNYFDYLAEGESEVVTFGYTVSDGQGGSDTASVSVTITGLNDAPFATDDVAQTDENTAIDIDVLANDFDIDGDALTIISVSSQYVTITDNGTKLRFDPNYIDEYFYGFDWLAEGETTSYQFSYAVQDAHGEVAIAEANVDLTGINDAPNLYTLDLAVTEGSVFAGQVTFPSSRPSHVTAFPLNPIDWDNLGDVTFALQNIVGDTQLFEIDPSSGLIRFKSTPDFETPLDANGDNVYEVGVTLSDGYSQVDKTISITVKNVSDETGGIVFEGQGLDAAAETSTQYSFGGLTRFRGDIASSDDRDWVQVQLDGAVTYQLELEGLSLFDGHIAVYDAFGNLLAADDNSGLDVLYGPKDAALIFSPDATGTYYLEARSSDGGTGDYELLVNEAKPEATLQEIGDYLASAYGATLIGASADSTVDVDFSSLRPMGQQLAQWALEAWSGATGMNFVSTTPGAVINIYETSGWNAYAYPQWNDVYIGSSYIQYQNRLDGTGFGVFMHELGHAIGLPHSGPYNTDGDYGDENIFLNDSSNATIMSYFASGVNPYWPTLPPGRANNFDGADYAYFVTPMVADHIAIQQLYGVPTTVRTGDTVYGSNTNVQGYLALVFGELTGELDSPYIGEPTSEVDSYRTVAPMAFTIYDSDGHDTIDFGTDIHDQNVDLRELGYSDVFGVKRSMGIAPNTVIENYVAGSGDDLVQGNAANNQISGGAGNDLIYGADGDDVIFGQGGADILSGGDGADELHGQNGIDTASYLDASQGVGIRLDGSTGWGGAKGDTLFDIENLIGSSYGDTLIGDDGDNVIDAGAGDDTIYGHNGADMIFGGDGADEIRGQGGTDTVSYLDATQGIGIKLDGSTGWGAAKGDTLFGIENLIGSSFNDTLVGDSGENVIEAGDGDDVIYAKDGNDTIIGGAGADEIRGQGGTDTVTYADAAQSVGIKLDGSIGWGAAKGDTLFGIETLIASSFDDTLAGDDNDNVIDAGDGDDVIYAKDGNDTIIGGAGADEIRGQGGTDTVTYADATKNVGIKLDGSVGWGAAEGDTLFGIEILIASSFHDTLVGDDKDNVIDAGDGDDVIYAKDGNDTIIGGAGNDELYGQGGLDIFVFIDGFGQDVIHGFAASNPDEKIDLSGLSTIASVQDLFNLGHLQEAGNDVILDDFSGNTITLVDVALTALDVDDFVF